MKPYGVRIEEYPDVADIKKMASKSSTGKLRKKSGDFLGYIRGYAKKRARRYWKRIARRLGKKECNDD